ncbi:MAG: hypothetical protein OEL79_08485, partial [Chromatiales bacterium]|nr:hypothetical protein [Chromatiales bacterium]
VLLFGIYPLWGFTADQVTVQESAPINYGPVVATDTLAEISLKLKADSPWHYQRWMYALYKKNPQAFFGDNMNNLKLGAILRVPTAKELEQIDLAEAFRAVKVHLYVLEQGRHDKKESNDELLVRARLQRLFVSNENMQKESGELFERISALEQQMGHVVDRVLESEGKVTTSARTIKPSEEDNLSGSQPLKQEAVAASVSNVESAVSSWWFALLGVIVVYLAGFLWRRRLETAL